MSNSAARPKVPPPLFAAEDDCAITAERLAFCVEGLKLEDAYPHANALEAARPIAELNTHRRVRHFLAQCAHETLGFKRLTESFGWKDPVRLADTFSAVRDVHQARSLIAQGPQAIANLVYAGKYGNGDSRSFDGWNFRGRGYLHVTFRDNYRQLAPVTGLDLEKHPELLGMPEPAARAAAGFWKWKAINRYADADDTHGVTSLINPALEGLDDRTIWTGRFRQVFP